MVIFEDLIHENCQIQPGQKCPTASLSLILINIYRKQELDSLNLITVCLLFTCLENGDFAAEGAADASKEMATTSRGE